MKWTSLAICAALAVSASTALADYPTGSGSQPLDRAQLRRPGVFNPLSWWTKYGEPVSAPASLVEQAPVDTGPAVAPATFSQYGYDYVYGPGSCDCPAPCTDHLWGGYAQNPWRCGHHKLFRRGCGHCCDSCGDGGCGCGPSCGKIAADCGCGAPMPTCEAPTCAAPPSCAAPPACGCKAMPTCDSCCKTKKCRLAHWHWGRKKSCDTCSLGCGCATPVEPGCAAPPACGCDAPIGIGPEVAPEAPKPLIDGAASLLNLPLLRRSAAPAARPAGYVR